MVNNSLRSKRFRLVSEQKESKRGIFGKMEREPKNETLSHTHLIFRAVFDSRSSLFDPKPHGNACYAGYVNSNNDNKLIINLLSLVKFFFTDSLYHTM